MVKKVKVVENQECTNVKFYLLAIVAVVAIVAVFAVYIGTSYTGEATTTKVRMKGSACSEKMDNCKFGCNTITGQCKGASLGVACSSDRDCEVGKCAGTGLKKICGGSGAECDSNSECATGNCVFLRHDKVYGSAPDALGECR